MPVKAGYLNRLLGYQVTNLNFRVLGVMLMKRFQTIIFVGTLSIGDIASKRQITYRYTDICHILFNNKQFERERENWKKGILNNWAKQS